MAAESCTYSIHWYYAAMWLSDFTKKAFAETESSMDRLFIVAPEETEADECSLESHIRVTGMKEIFHVKALNKIYSLK